MNSASKDQRLLPKVSPIVVSGAAAKRKKASENEKQATHALRIMKELARTSSSTGDLILDNGTVQVRMHSVVASLVSDYIAMFVKMNFSIPRKRFLCEFISDVGLHGLHHYIYHGDIPMLSNENCVSVLLAALEFKVHPVVDLVSTWMLSHPDPSSCMKILGIARKHHLQELFQVFAAKTFLEVSQSPEWTELLWPEVQDVLQWDELSLWSEMDVFKAFERWIFADQARVLLTYRWSWLRIAWLTKNEVQTLREMPIMRFHKESKESFLPPFESEAARRYNRFPIGVLWKPKPILDLEKGTSDLSSVSLDSQICVIGGRRSRDELVGFVFTSDGNNKFNRMTVLDPARSDTGCTIVEGCKLVVVVGGCEQGNSISTRVDTLDLKNATRGSLPDLKVPTAGCCVTAKSIVQGTAILVAGGANNEIKAMSETYRLKIPDACGWEQVASMKHKRWCAASCNLETGHWLVAGGLDEFGMTLSSGEAYNVFEDEWSAIPSMKSKRHSFGLVAIRNKAIAFGGRCETGTDLNTMEILTVSNQDNLNNAVWEEVSSTTMLEPRSSFGYTVHGSAILIFGGISSSEWVSHTDILDLRP